jgi:energy-coupling factor transporter ATP-binding protein EcfA2
MFTKSCKRIQFEGDARAFYFDHFRDAFERLANSHHVGPFRNVLSEGGSPTYFDQKLGLEIISEWAKLKQGHDPHSARKIDIIIDILKLQFHINDLQIDTSANKISIYVWSEKRRIPLSHMGSGFSEFLIHLVNLVNNTHAFIFIDETELHLHPSLQAEFVSTLRSFASTGVVFATHNIGLARTAADRIYTVCRERGKTHSTVRPWEKTGRLSELIGEMGFSAYQDLGFETILLVEGPTEIKTIQQVLRLRGQDHKVVAMQLGGDSMINGKRDQELEEIKRITPNICSLIDSERTSPTDALPNNRRQFKASCDKASISCHVTDRRATENYFTDEAVKSVKGHGFRALEHFAKLGDAPETAWGKNESWLIASKMSKEEWLTTDIGQFLNGIEALKAPET